MGAPNTGVWTFDDEIHPRLTRGTPIAGEVISGGRTSSTTYRFLMVAKRGMDTKLSFKDDLEQLSPGKGFHLLFAKYTVCCQGSVY